MECAKCEDIHLCLECLSNGKEIPPHKKEHKYYIIEYIEKRIFKYSDEWSGHEEMQLLEAIELYGLGNWTKISQHLGNSKNGQECEIHYIKKKRKKKKKKKRKD
ncbi:myb domain-containing protein [Reticulomyxa filosa]|uniref:Myb domain-containing protein n=1 Tax=Reticulomyxa filosa TaxID=46433 RepID=X6MKM3_RETFI|nr:myb domain-containing protein [Reticulomyxa filosa]|eukprot:ETO14002.1 myb domain-containing protein [Reticulomyxa filosa]